MKRSTHAQALRKTLQDVLANLPQDLVKGFHLIDIQDEIQDPAVLRQMPSALSQYVPKGRESVVRLFIGNILHRYRRKWLIRWRPTTRARLIAYAISHASVYHKYKGSPRQQTLSQEAKAMQLMILQRRLDVYPFEPWMKKFIVSRMKRNLAKKEGAHS